MILFNNILQTCNSYVGNGAHTVPLAHHKYNRIIIGKNIRLTGEALGYANRLYVYQSSDINAFA